MAGALSQYTGAHNTRYRGLVEVRQLRVREGERSGNAASPEEIGRAHV